MEILEAIEKRRSIRKFIDKEISKEDVLDILNCGRFAPSAKNRQPWIFVVASSEVKEKISKLMINYGNSEDYALKCIKFNCNQSVAFTGNVIDKGDVLVLILREKDDNWLLADTLSIGACVENMCLRATELGIGSLFISDIVTVSSEVLDLINFKDMELSCALLLGYPNQDPKMRPRNDLKNIVKWL
ncbi:MAG TPA: nitroreductase family protein [Candidatus Onthousia faecavium]|nr:nitroreductase family protein [Candidatus Onthousia faecavium]